MADVDLIRVRNPPPIRVRPASGAPVLVVPVSPAPVPVAVKPGPAGPTGPEGPVGPQANGYPHLQTTPAATWFITHNLGRYPDPILFLDDDPETPVWTDRFYPDDDHITIVLPEPATGWAYLY